MFALIPACEIRSLREEAPSNLATLCYKAVERLVRAADTGCSTQPEQQVGESSIMTESEGIRGLKLCIISCRFNIIVA